MGTDLYKLSGFSWAVLDESGDLKSFPTIELAAEHLEMIGVKDEDIDIALAEMAAYNHTRAQFGIEGRFIFSDESKPTLGNA